MKKIFFVHVDGFKLLELILALAILGAVVYFGTSCTPRTYVIKAKAEKVELDYQDQIHPKQK